MVGVSRDSGCPEPVISYCQISVVGCPTGVTGFYMKQSRWMQLSALALAALMPLASLAQSADPVRWQLNMGKGVTSTAHNAYITHMWGLWVCVVIGVIVFGAMFYAMFKFRRSKGAVASQFSHNTKAEIIWTVIPVIILVVLTIPAVKNLIKIYDTRDSQLTVRVTGYQWMWKYEYLDQGVSFTSRLDRKSDELRQSGATPSAAENPHYLLDVDNPLVLPVGAKVRFMITSDDVIHSWWVPALGFKQDANPGTVNGAWTLIEKPGVYRGQCAELCGKDHGFMPIVVKAVPMAEFQAWLYEQRQAQKAAVAKDAAPAPVATETPADPAAASPADAPAESTETAAPAAAAKG